MQVCFRIQRQAPDRSPWVETYILDVPPRATILECLNQIKWEQDGTLAFRKNCRNTICGSCAMRINGRSALACKQTLQDELELLSSQNVESSTDNLASTPIQMEIGPLHNFPVIKDLVVEMNEFWTNLAQVNPAIRPQARSIAEGEFRQSPAERAMLNQVGNCILCGACYAECNAKAVVPEFVGPHALAKAYRMATDTRDTTHTQRIEQYSQDLSGVWGCTRCFNCNTVCPMEVAPLDQITKIKAKRLAQPEDEPSRAVRHRTTMVELVAKDGWIDERKFGLAVVGNSLRDVKGVGSLIPLGLRMLLRRKFPTRFEASAGKKTVGALIRSILKL
ncbi:MAG TPA: succinate dehydrogenase/fumarate reductase iron-sulfur subunit [Stenomitos sp.]